MSLAFWKREKNFISVIDKEKPRYPEGLWTFNMWLDKLDEEVEELKQAVEFMLETKKFEDVISTKMECADVSILIDYIFEKLISGDFKTEYWGERHGEMYNSKIVKPEDVGR